MISQFLDAAATIKMRFGVIVGLLCAISIPTSALQTAQRRGSDVSAGKKIYQNNGCPSCHQIQGIGGMGGPDLTNEGAKPGRNTAYLKKVIVSPETLHKPSLMPPCTTLKPLELENLTAYLGSLKKKKR